MGMTEAEIKALVESNAKLQAEINSLKATTTSDKLSLRVSAKGAVSVYGLGKFPVTLYDKQMLRLLDANDEIRAFIQANTDKLSHVKPTPAVAAKS